MNEVVLRGTTFHIPIHWNQQHVQEFLNNLLFVPVDNITEINVHKQKLGNALAVVDYIGDESNLQHLHVHITCTIDYLTNLDTNGIEESSRVDDLVKDLIKRTATVVRSQTKLIPEELKSAILEVLF